MDNLIILSYLFVMVGIGAFCARRFPPKSGLRIAVVAMAVYTIIYVNLLIKVVPNYLF